MDLSYSLVQISAMSFTETQHLSTQAIRVVSWIMAGVTLFEVLLFSVIAYAERDAFVFVPASFTLLMLAAVLLLMRTSTLYVQVDQQGVFVKARWFHRRGRFVPWLDVQRVRLRPLRPMGEFGGWGIRYGFSNTWGYIYDGTQCLECTLADKKKVVISIVDADKLRDVLRDLGRVIAV